MPLLISIHALCEEGDEGAARSGAEDDDFYPRPLRGGRRLRRISGANRGNFYPRPLRGGRRCQPRPGSRPDQFLSTPSARRATLLPSMAARARAISIHALCEEGDVSHMTSYVNALHFYPRPLRGGRPGSVAARSTWEHFYPRPLRGGRLLGVVHVRAQIGISIHALCEEGDPHPDAQVQSGKISIHALCEEGDRHQALCKYHRYYFYPRPLRGGRLGPAADYTVAGVFLSTPSARRATAKAMAEQWG